MKEPEIQSFEDPNCLVKVYQLRIPCIYMREVKFWKWKIRLWLLKLIFTLEDR